MGKIVNNSNNISSAFITNYDFSDNNVNYYKDLLQEDINKNWEYASDVYAIEEETEFGSNIFIPVEVRITSAISSISGEKILNDWKQIIFKDVDHPRRRGTRYRFGFDLYGNPEINTENKQIWINTNLENYKTPTASAVIRRCNNNIKFLINNNTAIHIEPCIIEQGIKSSSVLYNDVADVLQSTITVTIQKNQYTEDILENDRFIIGYNKVYKVKNVTNFLSEYTLKSDSAPIIELIMQVDTKSPNDNFVLGITNFDKYSPVVINRVGYDMVINPDNLIVLEGRTRVFDCCLYNNGSRTSEAIVFNISGDETKFISVILSDNSFSIKNLKMSSTLVVVDCVTDSFSKSFEIQLGGLY